MKKILVTGGAGYIGSHTLVELLKNNFTPVVIDNLSNSSLDTIHNVKKITAKNFDFFNIDIKDIHSLNELFKKYSFSSVIHFAGLKSVSESTIKPLKYFKENVEGSINLFSMMNKYNVNKIVFSSSATVYGKPSELPIKESSTLNSPLNPYGSSKVMIEGILKNIFEFSKNWSVINLRYFNPVGAHESGKIGESPLKKPDNIMPIISNTAMGNFSKVSIYGNDYDTHDGTGIRDYVHVVDIAKAHIKALERALAYSEFQNINLGTGMGHSVLDLIKMFTEVSGKEIPYEVIPRRNGDLDIVYADPSYAEKILDWKAEKKLYDMCKDTWNWQKNNQKILQ